MQLYSLNEIQSALNLRANLQSLLASQALAFIDFSQGKITLPMPMQLNFPEHAGDCHIKAGYKQGEEYFTVKIATGFYNNYAQGLPAGDGAMLLFAQNTGLLAAILLDQGYLTTLRTALAACVAAQLTPFAIHNIGIVGTGNLATLCIKLMRQLYPDANIKIWGRNQDKVQALIAQTTNISYADISTLTSSSDLIITTTASKEAIITQQLPSKVHIIGLGADEPGKHEIAPQLFANADYVIVDNMKQAVKYGDAANAIATGAITEDKLQELGAVLPKGKLAANVLITSLTGIAAQDIAISESVLTLLSKTNTQQ